MSRSSPRFEKRTYEKLVVAAAYEFLYELATFAHSDGGRALIDPPDEMNYRRVGEIVHSDTPYNYPLTVREHSDASPNQATWDEAREAPEQAHVVIARTLFQKDVLAVAKQLVESEDYIRRREDSEMVAIDTESLPTFLHLTDTRTQEATKADIEQALNN